MDQVWFPNRLLFFHDIFITIYILWSGSRSGLPVMQHMKYYVNILLYTAACIVC